MRVRKILFGLALAVAVLLAACVQDEGRSSEEIAALTPTAAALTPTLLPGLPTSTPWSGTVAARPSPTATPQPSPTATPSATPQPGERLALGQSMLEHEDFAGAVEQYQAGLLTNQLTDEQRRSALLGLGRASLAGGQLAVADEALGMLLAEATASGDSAAAVEGDGVAGVAEAYFFQAQSYEAQGNCGAAIGTYEAYLRADPTLTALVKSRIAECHLALGERPQAIAAYQAAVAADAFESVMVANRYRLATLYQEDGDLDLAIGQYEAILETAEMADVLGRATYLAGAAELLAGDADAAYGRYLEGVERYPKAYESYLGLVALIDAGYEVDDLQRGIVDYHAKAYDAAVVVLGQYVELTDPHDEEAHLYLAWSFEGLGNVPAALEQLQVFIDAHAPQDADQATPAETRQATATGAPQATAEPGDGLRPAANAAMARGTLEKARMLARSGQLDQAAAAYAEYVALFADEADGPLAAWWSAALTERLGDHQEAMARYELLAQLYPEHEDADEALFRAGYLAYRSDDLAEAQRLWEAAVTDYPGDDYGAAALLWLVRTSGDEKSQEWLARATEIDGSSYYALRLKHIVSGTVPFAAPESLNLELSERDRIAAEGWLSRQLSLASESEVAPLSEALAGDGRLQRGSALGRLGLLAEAKRELESLRKEYDEDPLASYQLALHFRDLGLYRSSILAAVAVMNALEVDVFDAPRFIAGLAFPTYYADLITAAAAEYGYDPLLQFALVRQESLFESFATSGAAAQGLSQVIPDTGAYIAQRLDWPDYVNEDLYRPYVGIAFGAYYLDQQLDYFDGDVAAALSAYNAGPGNAARWYAEAGGDIDLYVDTVDFAETRHYIERIYSGQAIYFHIYGDPAS